MQTEIRELTEEQSDLADQEKQLSKKIDQAKQQQAEQNKQTDTRSAVIAAAKTHLGKPYVYGAAGPDAFDCSGLVQVAFASIGHTLGRTTVDQETAGTTIAVSEAQAGDLVFGAVMAKLIMLVFQQETVPIFMHRFPVMWFRSRPLLLIHQILLFEYYN